MYSKSLSFSSATDISFSCGSQHVEIFVNTTSLGKINSNFPVTIYITVDENGSKSITMEEISPSEYISNNSNARTIVFNQEYENNDLHVTKCSSSNKYSLVGTDDDDMGGICVSGKSELHFNISTYLYFKTKMEIEYQSNQAVFRMFVRYSQDVKEACGSNPECNMELFCYTCLF